MSVDTWHNGKQVKLSYAHEWLQKLPLSESMLVCRDCGITTKIGQWQNPPCIEHYVDK